jgi:hypothetical protein
MRGLKGEEDASQGLVMKYTKRVATATVRKQLSPAGSNVDKLISIAEAQNSELVIKSDRSGRETKTNAKEKKCARS